MCEQGADYPEAGGGPGGKFGVAPILLGQDAIDDAAGIVFRQAGIALEHVPEFGLPVVLWFWRIIRSGSKGWREDAILFSWLVLLSFLPVFVIYLISQRTEQAIWIDRYFIFLALPYLLLVAVAVNRLEPKWVRYLWIGLLVCWSLYAGLSDLRTNRMAWQSPQLGSRVRWEDLARRMIVAENDSPGPINVYTLTVISKGLRTGDWARSTSID